MERTLNIQDSDGSIAYLNDIPSFENGLENNLNIITLGGDWNEFKIKLKNVFVYGIY